MVDGMIVKEERIGGQRLILGDCLEVMKELPRFDLLLTDPPKPQPVQEGMDI